MFLPGSLNLMTKSRNRSRKKRNSTVDKQSNDMNTSTATDERGLANATQSARAEPEESINASALQSSDGDVTNQASPPLAPSDTPEEKVSTCVEIPAQLSPD